MAYRDIIVDKPLYRNGNYYVAVEDFANVAKEYAKGSRIKLCIEQKIGPKINKYRMSDTAFNELRTFDKTFCSSKALSGSVMRFLKCPTEATYETSEGVAVR